MLALSSVMSALMTSALAPVTSALVTSALCPVTSTLILCRVSVLISRPIIITLDGPNYIPWSQAISRFLKGRKLWHYVTGDVKALTQGAVETPTEFIRHEPGQSISAFLPQTYSIWDQLISFEPKWLCVGDSTLFAAYRDQQRLILFLMGLSDIYEPVRASLLHRIPLPILEQAISELLSEKTCLGLVSTSHVETTLATPGSRGHGSSGGSRDFSTSGTQIL
ncbi:hypothetical protein Acr_00g0041220 [Actinidia rufa]|uniref:Retrotransposon Copia-like N-terminal domain-containing protein n=1 Tax=Actinidia rufa TaxID=165716 RepID=A0A7J0DJ35_9ERIC|nr:hypothetical protein Acr_00g0041220 [Actinidia rufa]